MSADCQLVTPSKKKLEGDSSSPSFSKWPGYSSAQDWRKKNQQLILNNSCLTTNSAQYAEWVTWCEENFGPTYLLHPFMIFEKYKLDLIDNIAQMTWHHCRIPFSPYYSIWIRDVQKRTMFKLACL